MNDLIQNFYNLNWLLVALIFFAYMVIDAMYAYYTILVVELRPFKSATIGSLMHFLLAFGVINYTENFLYVIPLAIGSWFGTYFAVRNNKFAKNISNEKTD
jgi:hypothetical protein